MNLNTLQGFRHEVYGCFERAADALFNTVDALLTETNAHSFPELSLSPLFERRWCSLYEAFEDGHIDQNRLRQIFVRYLLRPVDEEQVWLGIDASSIERPQSKASPGRTVVYKPNLPQSSKPISYGWQFSTVVLLPVQPSSWTAVLDQQRIGSEQTSVGVAAAQLRELTPLVGCRPIVASDRWYSCAPFLLLTEGLPFDKLLRLKRKRVLACTHGQTRGATQRWGALSMWQPQHLWRGRWQLAGDGCAWTSHGSDLVAWAASA